MTALAEKIGQRRFHDFLRDVASDIAGPVGKARGGIHKCVGDAVIITWPFALGLANDASLRCAQDMLRILETRDPYYLNTYGTEARLRIALHCAEVAAGEIGDWKKEIALPGDPMNTAARIGGAAKAFDADIVVSGGVADHLSPACAFLLSRLPDWHSRRAFVVF